MTALTKKTQPTFSGDPHLDISLAGNLFPFHDCGRASLDTIKFETKGDISVVLTSVGSGNHLDEDEAFGDSPLAQADVHM